MESGEQVEEKRSEAEVRIEQVSRREAAVQVRASCVLALRACMLACLRACVLACVRACVLGAHRWRLEPAASRPVQVSGGLRADCWSLELEADWRHAR